MAFRDSVLVGFKKSGERRGFRNADSLKTALAMKELRAKGWTLERISLRFHISRQAVEQRLKKLEWVEKANGGGAECLG